MESANPGGTGKDRAARSMILDAERRGELPPPLLTSGREKEAEIHDCSDRNSGVGSSADITRCINGDEASGSNEKHQKDDSSPVSTSTSIPANIPANIHAAIQTALNNTRTHGILIEGTSGSTGISLASLSCSRGHGVIVVMPDDQSSQKSDFLKRLGAGVVIVQNCGISNPGHYVNVARRIWEWLQVERKYDGYYWRNIVSSKGEQMNGNGETPRLIKAAFMNQFENLANVHSHYTTTGPEIYQQLDGKVDAFVMSAGTGGTLVGVGGYLKEKWHRKHAKQQRLRRIPLHGKERGSQPPRIVLVDPPGSSLYNKIKHGVAYASQQSERRLRRHRYDTLAEGIGLDRVTANFGLGCEDVDWSESFGNKIDSLMDADSGASNGRLRNDRSASSLDRSRIIDDALCVTDQQAVYVAHHLLRHEGLFVGSSTAMNIAGALQVASRMPPGSNVVTVACDGGQRHTSRFWNREFVVGDWGLVWPGDEDANDSGHDGGGKDGILDVLGIEILK